MSRYTVYLLLPHQHSHTFRRSRYEGPHPTCTTTIPKLPPPTHILNSSSSTLWHESCGQSSIELWPQERGHARCRALLHEPAGCPTPNKCNEGELVSSYTSYTCISSHPYSPSLPIPPSGVSDEKRRQVKSKEGENDKMKVQTYNHQQEAHAIYSTHQIGTSLLTH